MKKIIYIIIIVSSFLSFKFEANALQCLYESTTSSDQIALDQHYWSEVVGYRAEASSIGEVTINDKTFEFTTTRVYNEYDWNDEWRYVDKCPKFLIYDERTAVDDLIHACDGKNCKEGDETFELIEPYSGKTPDTVGLKKLFCTYEFPGEGYTTEGSDVYSFAIKIKSDGSMRYSVYRNYEHLYDRNDIKIDGINTDDSTRWKTEHAAYFDAFQPRIFWEYDGGYYKCADQILVTSNCTTDDLGWGYKTEDCTFHIGYNEKKLSQEELDKLEINQKVKGVLGITSTTTTARVTPYNLSGNASYIDYNNDISGEQICAYTYPGMQCNPETDDCTPLIIMSLVEKTYKNGKKAYTTIFNDSYGDIDATISSNITFDMSSCSNLPSLYTDCFTENISNCRVSNHRQSLEYDDKGNKLNNNVQELVPNDWSNTQDATDPEINMAEFNGYEYRNLLCQLSDRLKVYIPDSELSITPDLYIYSPNIPQDTYKINTLNCKDWGFDVGYECSTESCKDNINFTAEKKIIEINQYCSTIYKKTLENYTNIDIYNKRKDECDAFDEFYKYLAEKGYVSKFYEGCDILSPDFRNKLIWILDVFKIAGPIMAVILGMIDFTKVIVSGEADKEMNSAWKRFKTRLIAAALLFIIPMILSMLINIFIGDTINNNVYCDLFEEKN